MALVNPDKIANQSESFFALPALRQLGFMIAVAASIAVGVAVVLWSQQPTYSVLFGSLAEKDTAQVMDALQKSNIPYKLDQASGAVMVPTSKIHDARLQLASVGLPKGMGSGFEWLEEGSSFGTSQFVEMARYHRALEHELSRTITSVRNVQAARVHLALPKQSVFVRKRLKPSASVVINLYPGRTLESGQVSAIVHMVASSVSRLEPDQVTVVDQNGHLLSAQGSKVGEMALTSSQFEYTKKLEDFYVGKIESLLSPILGVGGVRAQVSAEIDFTYTEKTEESFNPDLPALRSEQTFEEQGGGALGAQGIPGTLSNQPPPAGIVATGGQGDSNQLSAGGGNRSRKMTKNYELDKTISHTKMSSGQLRRLTVAVVVDDRKTMETNGTVTNTPIEEQELSKLTNLVKEAIGFDTLRGDRVNVINAAFQAPEPVQPLPDQPIWEQAWALDAGKIGLGVVAFLVVLFGVIKPALRTLADQGEQIVKNQAQAFPVGPDGVPVGADQLGLGSDQQNDRLAQQKSYEDNLNTARSMVNQDPQLVAQVVKNWVGAEDE